jgi:ABC-type glycerol-3-phosphate transport system substrate-binding protein
VSPRSRIALCLVLAVCSGCAAQGSVVPRGAGGRPALELMAVWTGTEQRNFQRVLTGFETATGVTVTYTPAAGGVPGALAARVGAGRPPDVAFLPQPGTLRQYAARGLLVPLDRATTRLTAANYSSIWQGLASVAGRQYGVWFKAANKSLVWYNVGAFEHAGVVPPDDVNGLIQVGRVLTSDGVPAFAVGAADAWTLDDWFANLYLRVAGAHRYDLLAGHRIPWTDPSVKATLTLMSEILAPELLAGGPSGALRTTFLASVAQVFSDPPAAAMTSEAEFVIGALPAGSGVTVGVDADVFPFPSVGNSGAGVVAGGDLAVMLRASPAAVAFLRYLATPAAAALWASHGGFISPNVNLDLSVYPDAVTRSIARGLVEAGDSLRFGLGDLEPPGFGATEAAGMEKELRGFLVNRDVDGTAARLEAAAGAAFGW